MRFNLIDKIVEVQAGVSLKALKNLTLGEEYLADHFPTFPVMPGVLMLQTLVEAGAWLLRISEDFAHSVIVLREAKNIKYGNFMEPGKQMLITVELVEKTADLAVFKGKGEMEGQSTVSARITLARYNLRDKDNSFKDTDEKMIAHYKELHRYLSMKA
ncbi:MAG: beta-hydroxyacyl-ACP dehydratase [Planctomycetota bacterium]|jgi:3-hydroxyacyl-[acyl-carrier-protein] dehydratase|nr:hydroxymyristoyl-ACP dehydratase [Gemmataceae bacterium]NBS90717.1 beta-hydroxyacyl-ACP dehydratase [bacterium]NBT61441.1 beta-hydroxyacyl-ACP dehydratase [Planctomycetia bacterium]RLS59025.1 MAG: beta-hydroxyacyl-ACP dehydratase [Planctomycetota bacterium]